MAKSASKPRIPVCVRFIPEAFAPPWPPITATAPALPAAFRKSPKMANRTSPLFFASPCMTTITIFPESREACLTSSSISKRFTVATSPSTPPACDDPVQPIASTCNGLRIGSSNSPCAAPRVHPRQSWYFSVCTFSRPMAFILATPHSSAFLSAGVPVTRAPMSSLSSVRYWKACESIIPWPAILTSAGFVPSSSGPLGVGRLSAHAARPAPKENPSATTATAVKTRRIRFLLTPSAHPNSTTLSDAQGMELSPRSVVDVPPLFRLMLSAIFRVGENSGAQLQPRHKPALFSGASMAPEECLYELSSPLGNCTPLSSLPFPAASPTLPFVTTMRLSARLFPLSRFFAPLLLIALAVCAIRAQEPANKKAEKAASPEKTENPAQIEQLETHYRFEANGDSRKEVHARVHINSELGVRQFARLNFDYNRSFESIEIPLVHITHPSGGTADILPSAITDQPNPAVVNAPAYQDVRVKSVRVLSLAPGDALEYRVVTTVSHHPLAPHFWLDHSFDRTGVVSEEIFETDVPASRKVQLHVAPESPYEIIESEGQTDAHVVYRWHRQPQKVGAEAARQSESAEPDVILSTFQDWREMVNRIAPVLRDNLRAPEVVAKAAELSQSGTTPEDKFRALYDFVSQKILTVDLPLGTTGFRLRSPLDVISSGYAIPEEKCALLSVLASGIKGGPMATPALALSLDTPKHKPPRISALSRVLVEASLSGKNLWLDPSIEVAPLGLVPSDLRGKFALRLFSRSDSDDFDGIATDLPFAASQRVHVSATLAFDGKLTAKVHYALRGDSELLL